jgi:hypothetical protein
LVSPAQDAANSGAADDAKDSDLRSLHSTGSGGRPTSRRKKAVFMNFCEAKVSNSEQTAPPLQKGATHRPRTTDATRFNAWLTQSGRGRRGYKATLGTKEQSSAAAVSGSRFVLIIR